MSRAAVAVALCAGLALPGGASAQTAAATAHPERWPEAASPAALTGPRTTARVEALLAAMTVEEKVGQLIQADIGSVTPADLAEYPIGSILAGGSSGPGGDDKAPAATWRAMTQAYQSAAAARPGARIPLLLGIDAVHGHANIPGATVFPHNIGLGATRDPALVSAVAAATAEEVAATGFNWTFAPTLAVPRDDRWGRTYEGFAEDPEVQRLFAGPYVHGLQGELRDGVGLSPGHVMGSAKHFLADGGTLDGRDRGDAPVSEQDLIDIHLSGYPQAIDAGVLAVMVSFSGWNGVKHTGNASLLTGVLRDRLGFRGLLIGDWDAHAFVPGCRSDSCPAAINAGLDMFMAPSAWKALYRNTLEQVRSGGISQARLDQAVGRILAVKVAAGLFDPPTSVGLDRIGAADHRALARRAVRESLVLLKNNGGVLPIRPGARVLVAGAAADDVAMATGGWTFSWQGTGNSNADFPGAQSIWTGLAEAVRDAGGQAAFSPGGTFTDRPDVAVVVFGEAPYAEFYGDLDTLDFVPTEGLDTLRRLKAQGIPTVAVFLSGRPLWTNPEINAADAFVAAWLPGGEGGGVADVLVAGADGRVRDDFRGRLGFSWPRTAGQAPQNRGQPGYDPLFAYGYGLSYARPVAVPRLSEDPGLPPDAAGPPRIFANGRFVAPWSVTLRDADGSFRVEQPGHAASPRGVVTMEPTDGAAQESARRFRFLGDGGAVVIGGPPTAFDPTLALTLRVRSEGPSAGALRLFLGDAGVDLAPSGDWRVVKIPLSCFGGADLSRTSAIRLEAPAASVITIDDVRLEAAAGLSCPRGEGQ